MTTLAPGGAISVGAGEISLNDDIYEIAYPNGERLFARDFGDRLDLGVTVSSARGPGTLRGLLGNVNGSPSDDLALPDGITFTGPIAFADLYGAFADGWRVTDAKSLFDYGPGENTADYTESGFPRQEASLDSLPADLVAAAEAAVDDAGITDAALRQAAILDYALTGDPSYIESASDIADPVVAVEITQAPATLPTLSIAGRAAAQAEGTGGTTPFVFAVFRTGNTSGAIDVTYEVVGSKRRASRRGRFRR